MRLYELCRYRRIPRKAVASSPGGVGGAGVAQAIAIAIALAQGFVIAIVELLHLIGALLLLASVKREAWPLPEGAEDEDAVGE